MKLFLAVTQFHGFFNFCDMEPIMESFCAYHINAPGQEAECESFPQGYKIKINYKIEVVVFLFFFNKIQICLSNN